MRSTHSGIITLALLALLHVSGLSQPHAAADDAAEPSGYREQVEQAVREYELGHFEEARSIFVQAHALFPNARTHRGIAMSDFELRNYGDCISHIEAALASPVRPLDDKLRADAEALRVRAQAFLSRLVVFTRPVARSLLLDGRPVEGWHDGKPLVLQMGRHVLDAEAPGRAREQRQVVLKGGESRDLTIVFGEAHAAPATPATPAEVRWYRRPWIWVLAGAVVTGAAVGGTLAARGGGDTRTLAPTGGSTGIAVDGPTRMAQ